MTQRRNLRQTLGDFLLQFDYLLLLFLLLTTGYGLIVLSGSTYRVEGLEHYPGRQALWWAIATGVFFLALLMPYHWLKYLGWPLYIISVLSLIALLLNLGDLAASAKGARSWFNVPGTRIRIQPSEFTKIAVVVVLAQWLAWRREKLHSIWECGVPFILTLAPLPMILIQPDLGTTATFLPLPFIILFLAGLRWRIILVGAALGLAMAGGMVYYLLLVESLPSFLRDHQKRRIESFRQPLREALGPILKFIEPPDAAEVLYGYPDEENESGAKKTSTKNEFRAPDTYQIDNAIMALASGRIWGNGWGKGKISLSRWVPEHYTDFIFASLGEQFGLMGCLGLLAFYMLIAWRALHIAVVAPDAFGRYMVIGLLSVVLIHAFINIAITVKLLPVTGLPLPLISYGGSFLVTNYLIFGLIANVSMRRRENAPDFT